MNIFTFLFGDPQAQQNAINVQFTAATKRLRAARLAGNKAAEQAALAEMRSLAKKGATLAAGHVNRVNTVTSAASSVSSAAHSFTMSAGKVAIVAALAFVAFQSLKK